MRELSVWILTVGAGLATCLGAVLVFCRKKQSDGFLSFSLSFSAGVMMAVSLCDLLPHALGVNRGSLGNGPGGFFTFVVLCAGMCLAELLRKKVPEPGGELACEAKGKEDVFRVGVVSLLAVAAHNFPEGMLVSLASMQDLSLGAPVAVAIALHNIPEGIAIAAPVVYATGKKGKAFLLTLFAGMTEPLGAFITLSFLEGRVDERLIGILFSGIAGLMLAISFGELLPAAAQKDSSGKTMRWGLFAGSLVMLLVVLAL